MVRAASITWSPAIKMLMRAWPECSGYTAGLEKIKPEDNFDFEKEVQPITIDSIQNQPVINASKTVKDFQTLEQYQDYLLEKAEQNALKTEAVSE